MIERRWIQKGYRIFFAIALLICVGGIPAYAEELVPDAGEITGRVLFISSYSYAWETVPEQIRSAFCACQSAFLSVPLPSCATVCSVICAACAFGSAST